MQLHTNVPGIGDSLWDLYIHPWQHYLQSRGCELRLTTVLRGGSERLKADFDASNEAGAATATATATATAGGAKAGGDFCAFAADHANAQTKFLLSGSPALWPQEMRRLDPAADALLLPRASKVIKEMSLVGRAEQMDWCAQRL